jgi:hypothetical protein
MIAAKEPALRFEARLARYVSLAPVLDGPMTTDRIHGLAICPLRQLLSTARRAHCVGVDGSVDRA